MFVSLKSPNDQIRFAFLVASGRAQISKQYASAPTLVISKSTTTEHARQVFANCKRAGYVKV